MKHQTRIATPLDVVVSSTQTASFDRVFPLFGWRAGWQAMMLALILSGELLALVVIWQHTDRPTPAQIAALPPSFTR